MLNPNINPHIPSNFPQSSASSPDFSQLSTSGNIHVPTPNTFFKQLALKDAPHEAQSDLNLLITTLENNPNLDFKAASDMAVRFINSHKETVQAMECLFKYLNCRFQFDTQSKQASQLHPLNDKIRLRRSMTNLRGTALSSQSLSGMLNGPARLGPVLTSHPTQLNRPDSTESLLSYPGAGFDTEHDAENYAKQLWQVAGRRIEKPEVIDEAMAALPAIKNIIQSMRKSGKELIQAAEENGETMTTLPLEVGNWIGGDRDGNPTITPQLLAEIVGLWSNQVFEEYQGKLNNINAEKRPNCLHNLFSEAGCIAELNNLKNRVEATKRHVVDRAPTAETSNRFENPDALREHVASLKDVIEQSTLELGRKNIALRKLVQLESWVKTFGFHGVSTHIRQNSEVNQQTVGALLDTELPGSDYTALPEEKKVELLSHFLNDEPGHILPSRIQSQSAETQREIEFLESYRGLRARYGDAALPTIITANTETLSDMLEVSVLLKYAGLHNAPGTGMNVVPLIETVPDMKNAKQLLEGLLTMPCYRAHLKTAGNVQQVMLGYSDSMRANGIVSAAWEAHKRPTELKEVADANGVKLHFFHGRGGTEARGSRDSYTTEIAHLDGGSLHTGYTQTEQGEEVFKKFGSRKLSDNSISNLISAAFETNARGADKQIATYGPTLEIISTFADQAYQSLYQASELADFLQQTTPLPYLGLSNAGSRPASRIANLQGPAFLAKLRAIPYVAAWYQSGSMAPAYFGLGSGIKNYIEAPEGDLTSKIAELKEMYKEWPFFENLVDRAETAMDKANMTVAKKYAELSPDNMSIFNKVETEFKQTQEILALIKGQNIEMPVPKRDGLRTFAHAAQIELLRQIPSATPATKQVLETGVAMSMQTIGNAIGRFG